MSAGVAVSMTSRTGTTANSNATATTTSGSTTADTNDQTFQSPSGNIACSMHLKAAQTSCDIGVYSYPPPKVTGGDSPCAAADANRFNLAVGHPPAMWCQPAGLTMLHAPGLATLDYGQTRSVGSITCDSEPTGMTCTDSSTGNYFRVSRESYDLGPTASGQQPGLPPSSTAPSATVTATGTPGNTSSPSGSTASARFIAHWHVHGATLDIAPTTATLVFSHGPCVSNNHIFCSETDTLAVVSGDDTQVTLAVTAVRYTDSTGASVNPTTSSPTAVGDSMQLVWQAPGLLKQTVLRGFGGSAGGNPYWCGPGISQNNLQLCGA